MLTCKYCGKEIVVCPVRLQAHNKTIYVRVEDNLATCFFENYKVIPFKELLEKIKIARKERNTFDQYALLWTLNSVYGKFGRPYHFITGVDGI